MEFVPDTRNDIDSWKEVQLIYNSALKEIGTNYILDLLSAVKYKFELLKEDYIPVEHDGYHNFYEKQFIEVIEEYHPYWKAHSSIGSFDYHLCIEDISSIGIEFYAEYLIRLEQEEILLKQFDQSVICDLLTVCVHGESDSQINLYECVLLQVIGLMLLEKPWKDVDSLFLNENEKEELYFRYKEYDLLELREEWGNVIKKKLSNIPFTNWIYVEETISYILMRIYMSMEHQTVKELWQSANDAIKMENIQDREYNLPTKELKKVIGMIQDCDLIREKIAIIQTRIHSIDDLIEVLSEAVFGEEVIALFQQLSEKQLGELLRYVLSQSDRYDLYERDKMPSWHMELLMYLNGLSQESKDRIQADN